MGLTGYGSQPCSWSAEQKNIVFPLSPFAPENLVARESGSVVPSRVSLAVLHTQVESGTSSRDSSRFRNGVHIICLQPPSGQSRVYRVTQLRTDGVYRRESAGTGPVLKVVPVTGAAFFAGDHGPINVRLSSFLYEVVIAC